MDRVGVDAGHADLHLRVVARHPRVHESDRGVGDGTKVWSREQGWIRVDEHQLVRAC